MIPSAAPGTGAGALLERNAELSMLAESLEAVERSARGRVLLVGGEAGAGKTTLLRRFLEERGRSARLLWGACDPLFTPSPLGPLLAVAYHRDEFRPGARTILYCASGGRSALACDSLRGLGYERLAHLDSGLKAWKEAGGPTQPRP